MKKVVVLGILALLSACSSTPQETYPYGMSEKEWNELSIKDKAMIRRDFYFVEKGNMNFVNPMLEIEGKKEEVPYFHQSRPQEVPAPAAGDFEPQEK